MSNKKTLKQPTPDTAYTLQLPLFAKSVASEDMDFYYIYIEDDFEGDGAITRRVFWRTQTVGETGVYRFLPMGELKPFADNTRKKAKLYTMRRTAQSMLTRLKRQHPHVPFQIGIHTVKNYEPPF